MSNSTATTLKDIKREWHLVSVKGEILGRISTRIAQYLIGKSKPYYVPHLDCGDYVVVINAKYVEVTGKKKTQKLYSSYSGYPGGLKQKSFNQMMSVNPAFIIKEAVSGMLPQNKLKSSMLKRLYIYSDENHPYKDRFSK